MAVGNLTGRETSLSALKLDEVWDKWIFGGSITTSSTSFVDVTNSSITFTPATTGDYLIIGNALINKDTTASSCSLRLWDGTTATNSMPMRMTNTNDTKPWAVLTKVTLTGGVSVTYSIQTSSTTSGTVGVMNANLVFLRLDRFQRSSVTTAASGNTTSATYVTIQTNAYTPTVGSGSGYEHLVLFCGSVGALLSARTPFDLCAIDSTTQQENVITTAAANTQDQASFLCVARVTTNSAFTATIQYKSGAGSSQIQNAVIAVLQCGGASVEILGATIKGATIL